MFFKLKLSTTLAATCCALALSAGAAEGGLRRVRREREATMMWL
jgi:hypothetical protein